MFIIIFICILLMINIGLYALYVFYFLPTTTEIEQKQEQSVEAVTEELPTEPTADENQHGLSDKYYAIHFSFGDAVALCIGEAESRNSNLIQVSLNEHSSRFNEREKMYLIMLNSYVGTRYLYDEKEHKCEIDPEIQGVIFYKEIVRRSAVRPVK